MSTYDYNNSHDNNKIVMQQQQHPQQQEEQSHTRWRCTLLPRDTKEEYPQITKTKQKHMILMMNVCI